MNTHAPPKPVRYIINTSSLPHSIGGNEAIAASGVTYTGGNVAGTIADSSEGAAVLAHENVLNRMVDRDMPFSALPTETFFTAEYKVSTFFNEEGVQIVHVPNAATDGDSFVFFRGSDVIAAGDLFNMDSFPIIDVDSRRQHQRRARRASTAILKLAIPEFRTEGGTMVIPGHGRLGDSADVGYYRDMLTIIRDQVQALIDEGLTLEQVIERRPTFGYEARFGSQYGRLDDRDVHRGRLSQPEGKLLSYVISSEVSRETQATHPRRRGRDDVGPIRLRASLVHRDLRRKQDDQDRRRARAVHVPQSARLGARHGTR